MLTFLSIKNSYPPAVMFSGYEIKRIVENIIFFKEMLIFCALLIKLFSYFEIKFEM